MNRKCFPVIQAPAVLLLDELTSFLDAGDQAAVLKAVRGAVDAGGVTAIWVCCHNLRHFVTSDGLGAPETGGIWLCPSISPKVLSDELMFDSWQPQPTPLPPPAPRPIEAGSVRY